MLDAWAVQSPDVADVGSCSCWMLRLCKTWTLKMLDVVVPEKIAKLPSGDKSVGSVADFDILGLGFTDRPSG